MKLSSKNRRIFIAVFAQPIPVDILWADVETLLVALGAELSEGRGSRVRVALAGVRAVFHRPHPQRETDRGALRSLRRFLAEAGLQPEEN